jgi:hypothetical protein
VSLILEALRKLERDKDAPERGFLVTAHVPWARVQRPSRLVGLAVLALALAVAALAAALWRGRGTPATGAAGVTPSQGPAAVGRPSVPPASTGVRASVAPPGPVPSPAPPSPRVRAHSGGERPAPPPPASSTPPAPAGTAAPPELRLHAISRQDDRPVAIINDRLVREGDVFDDVHVIRIGETEVEVEVRGQRRVLTF